VNNAGIVVPAPLEFLPAAELRAQLEVNVVGQHAVTAAFLPLLRAATGRVVMMGSIGDRITGPLTGAYHASKWALAALTHVLRMELHSTGVQVVLIEPGAIATPIWKTAAARGGELEAVMPAEGFRRYSAMIAAARANAVRSARTGLPPEVVAGTVERALTVARPRTRYLVGRDARLLALVARLPDRLRDRLTLRQATAT
jgi:NAD(P)-dependent dehydrogenase (short-subunit alcohol dehydrogenase family)